MRSTHRLLSLALALLMPLAAVAEPPAQDDLSGRLRLTALNNERLAPLARANDVSTLSIMAANWGLDQWAEETREQVLLPTAHLLPKGLRSGILINRAEYRLYYFVDGHLVQTSPIGIGEQGMETPLGITKVVRKVKDPAWYPTPEARAQHPDWPVVVPPGPDNPMGAYAMYLAWTYYAIHGSNDMFGVGRPYTRGCVRLFPEDIEALYGRTAIGTAVEVVDQPVKLGWHEGELFLEAHPDFAQLEELRVELQFTLKPAEDLKAEITAEAGARVADVDWAAVKEALERRAGVPVQITSPKTHPINLFEPNVAMSDGAVRILKARQAIAPSAMPRWTPEEQRAIDAMRKEQLRKHPYNI